MTAWDDLSDRARWYLENFDELTLAEMLAAGDRASHPDTHRYLSTSCLHGEHSYCQSNTGAAGTKTPAQCKFCAAPCVCDCHAKLEAQQA